MTKPMRVLIAAGLAFLGPGAGLSGDEIALPPSGQVRTYEIDSVRSRIEIFVGRAGLLRALGHDHSIAAREFSGRIVLDPARLGNSSLTLRVAAASLTVLDPGEAEKDRAKVQATLLGPSVLDTARFPEIRFTSTSVTGRETAADLRKLTLAGNLDLHGVEKTLTVPVALRLDGVELEAQGDAELLQTDFGIAPVKVAGGMVKVEDRLRIHFVIRARAVP